MMTQMRESKTSVILISIIAAYMLCLMGACCLLLTFFFNAPSESPRVFPTPTLDLACAESYCLHACLRRMPDFAIQPLYGHEEELSNRPDGLELARYRLNEKTKALDRIVTPTVPDYLKPYQNEDLHRRIWNYFTAVFPQTDKMHISYMIVYTDGVLDGYAARIWNLDKKWRLYVDILDFDTSYSVTATLIHEYGHMLTLGDTQIKEIPSEYFLSESNLEANMEDFTSMKRKCNYFFDGNDCAQKDSYYNAYGQKFWTGDIYDTWVKVYLANKNKEEKSERDFAINRFYSKYPSWFVSRYAATSPGEDIAESWETFVMNPRPAGDTIADQKTLFFYDFPELVDLRRQIVQNACKYAASVR